MMSFLNWKKTDLEKKFGGQDRGEVQSRSYTDDKGQIRTEREICVRCKHVVHILILRTGEVAKACSVCLQLRKDKDKDPEEAWLKKNLGESL